MQNLIELVNQYGVYAQSDPNLSVADFCRLYLANGGNEVPVSLLQQEIEETKINNRLADNEQRPIMPLHSALGSLVGRMSRFALLYTKKALAPLNLSSIDDMVYLHIVKMTGEPRKSDVIYEALSEFPSGIDIIKRLVKQGHLRETTDEHDKRSKRLTITPQGETVLMQSYPLVDKAGDAAFNTLSQTEKQQLLDILQRLDAFHWQHYKTVRTETDIEAIVKTLKKA